MTGRNVGNHLVANAREPGGASHEVSESIRWFRFRKVIGLAATQVNSHKRIIVIDTSENHDQPIVLINPELIEKRGETGIEEGCLSVPECRAFVPRAEWVKVRAQDRHGEYFEIETDGLLAICLQHEMDHLAGKLFVDYLSPLKRQRIRQKLEKLARNERSS